MTNDPSAIVRTYWNRVILDRDLDAVGTLVTDPSIRHTADGTRRFTTSELKAYLRDALCAFRAEKVTFDAISVDGPHVWLRATVHAISLATMTPLTFTWLAQYRVEDDRIAEAWTLHQSNTDWSD
jgi:hypothetical protein